MEQMSEQQEQSIYDDEPYGNSTSKSVRKNKKISKNTQKKSKQEVRKQVKKQRQRNRRATHKQYVTLLEEKLEHKQRRIQELQSKVKELELQLQTKIDNIEVGNQIENIFCENCGHPQDYNQNSDHGNNLKQGYTGDSDIIEGDISLFFRDSNDDSAYGLRIGSRSGCLLLITMFCLLACAIAHNPANQQYSMVAYSFYESICTFSFLDFLEIRKQELKNILNNQTWDYGNTSCYKPKLINNISTVMENYWFQKIFVHGSSLFAFQVVSDSFRKLVSLVNWELLENLAAFYNSMPHHTRMLFANLVRINGY